MPYTYDFQVGLGGIASNLSAPLAIGAGVTAARWYVPRGVYHNTITNNYTGQYGIWCIPLSFSRTMSISESSFPYSQGADAAAFTAAGAARILFRAAIYEADVNGIPHTLIADMGYCEYVPGVDAADGVLGIGSFPGGPITLTASKQYYIVQTANAVTVSGGLPNTILATDTTGLITYNVGLIPSLDPFASLGLDDTEHFYQPLGISGLFPGDVFDAQMGAGNALDAWPATLGALFTSIFTNSNQIAVNVKGQPA